MPTNRHVLVGVGGGIAAYKVCEVVSALAKADAQVRVIVTDAAQQFISPLTFATLARHPAYTDQVFWQADQGRPLHIDLGEWAEVFLVAPLTANTLAKLAYGLADNLLTSTVLASTCPILLAPAMNTDMWLQQPVQRNWSTVQANPRCHVVGPSAGILACDRIGAGRMAEPSHILAHLNSLLHTGGTLDLVGKRLLISAGGTREYLDPVRFIGNPSTGKMGVALAQAALHRGAQVTFVYAPTTDEIVPSERLRAIPVVNADEMQHALLEYYEDADWIVMSAAVADVKPADYSSEKLPKRSLPSSLPLVPVPDILMELSQRKRPDQMLIGFAAQTGDILTPALEKLERKHLDAIAANPIDQPNSGFGSDQNQAVLIDRHRRQVQLSPRSKLDMAHALIDFVLAIPSDRS